MYRSGINNFIPGVVTPVVSDDDDDDDFDGVSVSNELGIPSRFMAVELAFGSEEDE